jgi:putative transposase
MKGKRHTPDQVIVKLREADAMLGTGATIGQVCQQLAISEQTFHRWRNQYGGMKANEAKRLKELEQENARLKKLVAEQALANAMLKEVAEGNW